MNAGRLIFGIVVGAAAGALIGVLFAPDKGTETRRKLMEKGDNYTSNLKNKYNNFKNSWGKSNGSEFVAEDEFQQKNATTPLI